MKKTALFLAIVFAFLLLFTACGEEEKIEYIKSQSAVLSYEREENKVAVRTLLTLKNYAKRDVEFTVSGIFSELYAANVTLFEEMSVTDKDGFSERLTIPSNSTVCIECVFRATYGGGTAVAGEDGFFAPPESLTFEIIPESTYGVGD